MGKAPITPIDVGMERMGFNNILKYFFASNKKFSGSLRFIVSFSKLNDLFQLLLTRKDIYCNELNQKQKLNYINY